MAAARNKAATAGDAVWAARNNPIVQRFVEDDDLREDLRQTIVSARDAYDRLTRGKRPAKTLLEDKKLHRDFRDAADHIRSVQGALKAGPKRRRRHGMGGKLLVLVVGAGLAMALSEGLRTKVLDALFGKEEEFDYTSTTSPNAAPVEPVGAA